MVRYCLKHTFFRLYIDYKCTIFAQIVLNTQHSLVVFCKKEIVTQLMLFLPR